MGDKVALMSDGEMTSGFGPILIHIIGRSPGCGNSHPPPAGRRTLCPGWRAVLSQFALLTWVFLLDEEEVGKMEPRK